MSYCVYCGKELEGETGFCQNCGVAQPQAGAGSAPILLPEAGSGAAAQPAGAAQAQAAPGGANARPRANRPAGRGLAIAGLVLAAVSLAFVVLPRYLPFVLAGLGVLLSAAGLIVARVKRQRTGLAAAGVIVGLVSCIAYLYIMAYWPWLLPELPHIGFSILRF